MNSTALNKLLGFQIFGGCVDLFQAFLLHLNLMCMLVWLGWVIFYFEEHTRFKKMRNIRKRLNRRGNGEKYPTVV